MHTCDWVVADEEAAAPGRVPAVSIGRGREPWAASSGGSVHAVQVPQVSATACCQPTARKEGRHISSALSWPGMAWMNSAGACMHLLNECKAGHWHKLVSVAVARACPVNCRCRLKVLQMHLWL